MLVSKIQVVYVFVKVLLITKNHMVSTQACGGTVYTEISGNITSPNYPQPYSSGQDCTYSVWRSQPSSFTLNFQRFNLELCGPTCTCDWVQIRCADDSYITPKYCGLVVPTTIFITNCNQILIQFRSDGSTVDTGFSLQYFVTNNVPTTSTTSTRRTATVPKCGSTVYTETSGLITSPNYPQPYSNGEDCTFSIWRPERSSFTFNFERFNLESCGSECTCDWVQIRCADDSYVTPKYCGVIVPMTSLINNCNQVLIWFRSDGARVDTGFSLQFFVTNNVSTISTTSRPSTLRTAPVPKCGSTVYTDETSGIITSPNYPQQYGNGEDCTYSIWRSEPSSFTLNFERFNLESCGSECTCDWVQIRCADDSYITPKYCGIIVPMTSLINNCNQVVIQFRSDGARTDIGFLLQYFVTNSFSTTSRTSTSRTTTLPTSRETPPQSTTASTLSIASTENQVESTTSSTLSSNVPIITTRTPTTLVIMSTMSSSSLMTSDSKTSERRNSSQIFTTTLETPPSTTTTRYGIYPIIGIVGAIVVGMIVLVIAIYLIQRCRSSPFSHTDTSGNLHLIVLTNPAPERNIYV